MTQPTKTLTFDPDTLEILRGLKWSDDGLNCIIEQQLDRAQYMKVNKALEAMGGKWNRSAKAHLFKIDPRPSVDGLLETGALEVVKDGFFETPRAVVERMIELCPFTPGCSILEPSAGLGAIVKILIEYGANQHHIFSFERNEDRANHLKSTWAYCYCLDFMKFNPTLPPEYDRVYMNPPFENQQDIEHVKHAFGFLAKGGALVAVMSPSFQFRDNQKSKDFRKFLDENNATIEPLPEGSFKESGTMVNTVLVMIE